MKIKKILIANRGEIVLRVARTCEKMGITPVGIYAQNDSDLPHAKLTESYCLGYGALSKTYLNQKKIIQIALDSECDAIHPGYGFLSENSRFAQEVESAGLIFIGPKKEHIDLMGDKKTSKESIVKWGIPGIPGYHGQNQDLESLKNEVPKVGFPLLIKASAGGGGKGMRVVSELSEFEQALNSVKREAQNAFGEDTVLLEKYIVNPRHIEVQVLSDSHGNHLHLFERECSAQRRHQKVIEEAPAVNLSQETKEKMYQAATQITKSMNYLGAGTVELIVDQKENFYFLEMNTRLQVEHPVTEMMTGVDLVEWQIRIAQGEALGFAQNDLSIQAHAIECRIYAENPEQDFLPTSGKIVEVGESQASWARLDSGYWANNIVGIDYDPMLAKLICHGGSREEARLRSLEALKKVLFAGVKTNRNFLLELLQDENFIQGKIHTKYIEQDFSMPKKSNEELAEIMALSFYLGKENKKPWSSPWMRSGDSL